LPMAKFHETIVAPRKGIVQSVDALCVGVAAWRLGAGRARKEDPVSAAAGVLCLVQEGDEVEANQPIFELHADDMEHIVRGRNTIGDALVIGDQPVSVGPLLLERIGK
jgi:thymidine phosphorylase